MRFMEEKIRAEGKVLPGNIIKVDGFLNHRVDTALMSQLADEFAKYFDVKDITMVLTAPIASMLSKRKHISMSTMASFTQTGLPSRISIAETGQFRAHRPHPTHASVTAKYPVRRARS